MSGNNGDHQERKIAFVGDYLPRQCGIATFTADLRNSVAARYPDVECLVVSVTDQPEGYDYPEEVRFEMAEEDLNGYKRAADFLNYNNVEVVSLQLEFGIYGGQGGEHILTLLQNLQMPVVTTLHTILPQFDDERQQVLEEIIKLSTRLVVMTERGQEFLERDFGVPPQKIHLIPHGIPDMPFVDPNFYKDQFQVEGRIVLLTFGLLTRNKGIEYVLRALPEIVAKHPDLVYIVLGATHPALLREEGEAYRESLEVMVQELGLEEHVMFFNQFVPKEELLKYIGTADLYITPYLYPEQITSGTLAYAFGCGKAVISTPYWYAEDLLTDNRGLLVAFEDSKAIAEKILYLLEHEAERHAMRKNAYLLGREMVWAEVAELYMHSFQEARLIRNPEPVAEPAVSEKRAPSHKSGLPPLSLAQLFRLTDSTGIVRHSRFHLPYIKGGYGTNNNACALVLAIRLQEMGWHEPELQKSADEYAAFIEYAFEPEQHRFHNDLSFDRQWLDETGPDETQGRVIWALGTCVGRSADPHLKKWATQLIDRVGPMGEELETPLAWAYTLLGIHEYFRRLSGDRPLNQLREQLVERLVDLFENNASADRPWFEETLSYESAKLAHALIESGWWIGSDRALEVGLQALRWLVEQQTAKEGYFRPVGYTYEGSEGQEVEQAQFEQYPLEAYTTISACVEAYHTTKDSYWLEQVEMAFNWFLGLNDLGQPLYDAETGGCHDALQVDRLNQNQGAEATLAFLLSLTELYSVPAFEELNWHTPPRQKKRENSPLPKLGAGSR